jgi:hypothetical protein
MKGQIHIQKDSLRHNHFYISRDLGDDKFGLNHFFIAEVTVNPDGWIYRFRDGEAITGDEIARMREGVLKLLPDMESTELKHFVAFA